MKNSLEQSIEHWKKNLLLVQHRRLPVLDASSCALCEEYHPESILEDTNCGECPVALRTGLQICGGTPYYAVRDLVCAEIISWDKLEAAVESEIKFLESLR